MPLFHYKAVTGSGEVVEGDMEAASQEAVVERLRDLGHLPVRADEVATPRAGRSRLPVWSGRVPAPGEIALVTRQLATLLRAGLPLDQALELTAELADRPALRRVLAEVLVRVRGGASLADALAEADGMFAPVYVGLVRAGEAGGSLDPVLHDLADHLERTEGLRQRVRSALIYPVVLLALVVVSVIVLVTVVVPQFVPVFESMGAEPPLPVRVLMGLGGLLERQGWLLLVGLVLLWLGLRAGLRGERMMQGVDRLRLHLPVAGALLRRIETARFARTLGVLLANGVPVLQAVAVARGTVGNRVMAAALDEVGVALKEGRELGEPLARTGLLPPLAVRLITVGERSGRLDEMLLKLAEILDREIQESIERLMALLVPALTLAAALVIALVIGSILTTVMSIYDLPY
jgi:general secretion pathway protein F